MDPKDAPNDPVEDLLKSLEDRFSEAVAREESIAASDLALSLMQGFTLHDALTRGGRFNLQIRSGASRPITRVGEDYIACGEPEDLLVPLAHVLAVRSWKGGAPRISDDSMLQVLRSWVRARTTVEVETTAGTFSGPLALACADHILVRSIAGEALIPLNLIRSVRAFRGG